MALPQSSAATEILTTLDEHRATLTSVLATAQKRVIIVSPYITEYAIRSDDLIAKIVAAQVRGVQVVVYTDNRLDTKDGALKPTALEGRKQLAQAFSGLFVAKKVHAKVLISDDDEITIGSFNWLSALRDEANQYSNHEQSLCVTGDAAKALIEKSITALDALEAMENDYSAFYSSYQQNILSYLRDGEVVPPENYLELLEKFQSAFVRVPGLTQIEYGQMVVAAHKITARVLGEEDQTRSPGDQANLSDDESTTSTDSTDSLEKLSKAFAELGIIELVHKAVVTVTF